jgi:hypothetical protein
MHEIFAVAEAHVFSDTEIKALARFSLLNALSALELEDRPALAAGFLADAQNHVVALIERRRDNGK